MSVLNDIDARSREIFKYLVEAYLRTGEPVGSRTLSNGPHINVSAATIRNVLADLAELGLLTAPHISAGRVPTELGLRLFVDSLMQVSALSDDDRRAIDMPRGTDDGASVLESVAARLSGLTQSAGLVVAQKIEAPLRHVEFVAAGPGSALAILVYEDGRVENRLIATPPGLPAASLISAGNYLATRLRGRSMREARDEIVAELEAHRAALDDLTAKLVRDGVADFAGGERSSLIIRGRGRLLDETAAADLERVRVLFDDLERKQGLIELLNAARDGDGVKIFIGSENRLFSLSGSSVIVAPYRDRTAKTVGVLGVIGPTRINYARVIPIVDYTAETVSRMLK